MLNNNALQLRNGYIALTKLPKEELEELITGKKEEEHNNAHGVILPGITLKLNSDYKALTIGKIHSMDRGVNHDINEINLENNQLVVYHPNTSYELTLNGTVFVILKPTDIISVIIS